MDALGTILTAIFVALIIAAALTFGFTILIFFMCVALLTLVLVGIREFWYRWRFVSRATRQEKETHGVIEADYKDITNEEHQ